jgi:hypothetical protein
VLGRTEVSPRRRLVARIGAAGGAGLLVVGSAGLFVAARAQTAPVAPTNFTVTAVADALSVEINTGLMGKQFPLVPVGQPTDFTSTSSTQAVMDSLGNDNGFASAPYAGSFVNSLPGTVAGVTLPGAQPGIGAAPPLPAIPGIVSSSYPGSEKAQQVNGPYGITSQSDPAGTTADARLGLATGGPAVASSTASSVARADPNSGNMVAQADSSLSGLKVSDLLSVGEVTSHAKLTATPGQKPVKETSFMIGLKILGIPVGLSDKGLTPGSGGIPGLDLSSLNKALSATGIGLEFLPAKQTDTSVDSAGVQITINQTLPVQGPVKTVLTFGHVMAALSPGDLPTATGGSGSGTGVSGGGGAVAGSDTSGGGIAGLGAGTGSTGSATSAPALATGSSGGSSPLPSASSPVVAPRPTKTTGGAGTGATGGSLLPIVGHTASSVFLALIGAALAVLAASALFGGLGVRLFLPSAAASGAGSVLQLPPPS